MKLPHLGNQPSVSKTPEVKAHMHRFAEIRETCVDYSLVARQRYLPDSNPGDLKILTDYEEIYFERVTLQATGHRWSICRRFPVAFYIGGIAPLTINSGVRPWANTLAAGKAGAARNSRPAKGISNTDSGR